MSTAAQAIGASSDAPGNRTRRLKPQPASAAPAVSAHARASPITGSEGASGSAGAPGKKIATRTGVRSTISSTRRYCMNATSRSSAPSSSEIPTIPDAPPATMPSAAVGPSSEVRRARTIPATSEMPSVAAVTSASGSHPSAIASSDDESSSVPSTTPAIASDAVNAPGGTASAPRARRAAAMPTSSAPNR